MRYRVKTVPLSKLIIGATGTLKPLCNGCVNKDCSLPIESRMVSEFGVNKNHKVLVKGHGLYFVVECEGFTR